MLIARFDVTTGVLPVKMHASDATALELVSLAGFGADLIRFPVGGCVPSHTHPGSHILFVISGGGWVDYDGMTCPLQPGVCYLVPGGVVHGIRAETELTLLAVANDHRRAGAEDRLSVIGE